MKLIFCLEGGCMSFLENLIDNVTKNKLEVLTEIKNSHGYISYDRLAQNTQFEKRTTRKYVDALFLDYQQFNNDKLIFKIKNDQEVKIEYSSYKEFSGFKQYITEHTFTITFFKDLLLGEDFSLLELSGKFFISEATIKRRIEQLNKMIAKYDLKIKSKKARLRLTGPESQIRQYAYTFFWALYKGKKWPFSHVPKERPEKMLETVFGHAEEIRNLSNIEAIYIVIAINLTRYNRGYTFHFSRKWLRNFFTEEYLNSEKYWPEMYHISEDEALFLLILAQMNTKFYLVDELRIPVVEFHQTEKTAVHRSVEVFFSYFSKEFTFIDEQKKEALYSYILSYHLFCFVFDGFETGTNGYIGSKKITSDFPNLSKKLYRMIDDLDQETKNEIFKQKEFLYERYAMVYSTLDKLAKFEPPISMFIDTDFPKLVEESLKIRLERYLGNDFNIHFMNVESRKQDEAVDVILATNFVEAFEQMTEEENIIYISGDLDLEDLLRIIAKIQTVVKVKSQGSIK